MVRFFHSLRLSAKIIGVVAVCIVLVVAVNYILFIREYGRVTEESIIQKGGVYTAVAEESKNHQSIAFTNGSVNLEALMAEYKADLESHRIKSYRESKFFGSVPVVVGWQAGQALATRDGLNFDVVSFDARNEEHEPKPGSFESRMLTDLNTQIAAGGKDSIGRIDAATNTMHYMRAIKLDDSCMLCHGDPRNSKTGDGKDVLGFRMENWKPGGTHGAFHVSTSLGAHDAEVAAFIRWALLWTAILVGATLFGFVLLLRSMLTRPVNNLVGLMENVANGDGDLTRRMAIDRKDEIGQLANWFDRFMANQQKVIQEVSGVANEVASAATEIAASSEEMSASISEVAQQTAKASQTARVAGDMASEGGKIVAETVDRISEINSAVSQSAASVRELGQRGDQIGAVIAVINDIADQTNLLALNAAIEAARAGEHGRGFAVVADEVRKLADRTTKATEEIGDSIQAIQHETTNAVTRMDAGAERVQGGVGSAKRAGESLEQIVFSATEVAGMIQSISAASEEAGAGASEAATAAAQLSQKSEQLRSLIGRFKV